MKTAVSSCMVVLACFALLGCRQAPTEISSLEGSAGELVKETHSVQADQAGQVEFVIPGFSPDFGVPLVQTYEVIVAKFRRVLLLLSPHTLDALGTVRMETDPNSWVLIVVVHPSPQDG